MNKISDSVRRITDWCAHAQARHPVRYFLCNLALIYLIITVPSGLAWSGPFAMTRDMLLFFGGCIGGLTLLEAYWWRPGGLMRRRYERWIEQPEQRDASTGWYADPTGRHRVRYLNRAKWTRWVADTGDAFEDHGAVRRDFFGPGAAKVRPRRALPLLLGFAVGGLLGIGLLVPALLFPHTKAVAFISADNTHPVGATWWAIGAAIVLAAATRALFTARARLQVGPDDAGASPRPLHDDRARAFAHSFVPMIAVAATAAWATWIQNGLMFPFPIFSFVALAACLAIALAAAILAVRVSKIEKSDHTTVRARGLVPALRGAYVATTAV